MGTGRVQVKSVGGWAGVALRLSMRVCMSVVVYGGQGGWPERSTAAQRAANRGRATAAGPQRAQRTSGAIQ
jgi:hypothetical protein